MVPGDAFEFLERTYRAVRALQARHRGRRLPVNLSALDHDGSPFDCAFVLEPLDIEMLLELLTPESTELVGEVVGAADELPLCRLVLMPEIHFRLNMDPARAIQALGKMISRVLCASGCSEKSLPVVDVVHFSWTPDTPAPMARICSALAETRTADTFEMSFDEEVDIGAMGPTVWGYLAYGLYSKHARKHSSIRNLRLACAKLTSKDAVAFVAVVGLANPVKLLFASQQGSAPPSERSRARWTISRGTTVTLQEMNTIGEFQRESTSWELATDVTGVQALSDGDEEDERASAIVLVPGFGVCKVTRDALRPVEDGCVMPANGGIIGLDLDDLQLPDDGEPLYRLLGLVGSSLMRLRLRLVVDEDFELDIACVLRSCPYLKTLIVVGTEVDAAAFVDAFREGNARIEELLCRFDDVACIIEELSDKTSPLTRSLKRVVYYFSKYWSHTAEWHIRGVLSMLEANSVLGYVEVVVPLDVWQQYAMSMQQRHNVPLPVAQGPLPLQFRLAFLSVFVASRVRFERDAKRAKHVTLSVSPVLATFPVDQHMMSIIFEFAAESLRRRVYCKPWKD